MPRLNVGDKVKILPAMETAFIGAEGLVNEIQPNDRGIRDLDRYVVQFKWGEKKTFYDAQLMRIET